MVDKGDEFEHALGLFMDSVTVRLSEEARKAARDDAEQLFFEMEKTQPKVLVRLKKTLVGTGSFVDFDPDCGPTLGPAGIILVEMVNQRDSMLGM